MKNSEPNSSKIEIFFSNLFSKIILTNEIVATILYVVGYKTGKYKEYIDKKLNKVIDNYLYYSLYTYDENKNYSKIEYYDNNGTLLSDS